MNYIKYLGVDWGEAKIGLAVGDNLIKIATPLTKVGTMAELLDIIKEEEADQLVLGKPLQISDSQLPISEEFKRFLEDLKTKITIPINLIDERLTTKQADGLIRQGSKKSDQDALAAMLILQAFLDEI